MASPVSDLSLADIDRRQAALRECPDLLALARCCSDLVVDYQSSAQSSLDQRLLGSDRKDKNDG